VAWLDGCARSHAERLSPLLRRGLTLDELVIAGREGLALATRTYRPELGSFATWATAKFRWAIAEELRHHKRRYEPSLDVPGLQDPDDRDTEETWGEALPDPDVDVEADALRNLEHEALRAAVARLPARERQLIEGRFWGGLTLLECGKRLGVGESRAHQIEGEALERLRGYLAHEPHGGE